MSATNTAEVTAPTIATPRERPILFSAEMVRAILEGRKTQTRRVVTPTRTMSVYSRIRNGCPYGLPGDRLWVREAWAQVPQTAYWHDPTILHTEHDHWWAVYRASWERSQPTWKPSIHMPRWASRITLEVTGVRVERIKDISHTDALAEGCKGHDWVERSPYIIGPHTDSGELPVEEYRKLWDRINAKRGFGWDVNPWVWVISFRRLKPAPEDAA